MPNVTISIGGQTVVVPGVYYRDQVATSVPLGVPTGPLVFIANGYGGIPLAATNYTDGNALINAMRGSPSAQFVNFMVDPSSELNGAGFITYINAAPNTQSTAAIVSGASTLITMTSADYGAPSNQLEFSVQPGSIFAGTKLVTLTDTFSGSSVSGDNLGVAMQIAYVGAASGVTYTVTTASQNVATRFQTFSPNAGESITIDLTSSTFANISSVAAYLNGTGYYNAIVVANGGSQPSSVLDAVSGIVLPPPTPSTVTVSGYTFPTATISVASTVGFTAPGVLSIPGSDGVNIINFTGTNSITFTGCTGGAGTIAVGAPVLSFNTSTDNYVSVTSTLGDIVYFINNANPQLAVATIGAIVSAPTLPPQNVPLAYFTGGTNVPPSVANYANALNVALTLPAWVVFLDNNSLGCQALGAQHVETASDIVNHKWRRFVTGSAPSETVATAITNAHNLNQNNVTYCWPGIQRTSTQSGFNTIYSGLYTAAAVAGMFVGNSVPTPVTNATLIGNGVEQITNLSNKINLQNNGVLVLDYETDIRIPTLLSDVTTWQNDSNAANVFNQQVSCRYALAYYMTQQLQPYVGGIQSTFNLGIVQNAVVRLLNAIIYNSVNSIGILNSWDPNSLVLNYDGSTQTLSVAVSVVFVGQNRFIVVTVTVNPLNLTSQSSIA